MEIVTGDRYLDMLARFVEENVAALLDGSRVLKLNPLGLHYLQARLDSLQELEQLHTAAPVDYLRAYIADLGDHRALELLRRVLGLLASVKVVSLVQSPARDPTPINLLPFERLRSLELRGCDLSTSAARGLLHLRPHLEKLICHNSTDALRHVLAERMVDIGSAQPWSRLASVSCACNALPVMDDSLHLLPAVEVLDLRRNRLTHVLNLGSCKQIKFLDLGFNWIQSVSRLDQVSSSLTTLILRFNALSITRGIDTLVLLRHLDISHNTISNFGELERFGGLRFLSSLCLQGNPVTYARDYREKVFSFFPDPGKLCLDGRCLSRIEEWKVHKLSRKRCKPDGAFGLYAPALKPVVPHEAAVSRGKKKSSRLAVIANEDGVSTRAEQALDATAAAMSPDTQAAEARLHRLVTRAQALKKDKQTMWLADVSDLFEMEEGSSQAEPATRNDSFQRVKQGSRRKRRGGGLVSARAAAGRGEVATSNKVLNKLINKQASPTSRTSPPHFNRGVLERRHKLLQVSLGQPTVETSDSSTSTSDQDASVDDAAPAAAPAAAAHHHVLGGDDDESCFSNAMWVGSSASRDGGGDGEGSELQSQEVDKLKMSRQAWRVAPVAASPEL
ncbi:serine/threonine-protein kinase 11-interacting protein-like [Selaginella moellendorffii]|uniref:serine/threonine-protein kinase 11-interacting protein-like n=1 Tax=Selaginella moellendorffii TaxID=88036 RepID=UPI000D1C996A|nr:serine/threonine-protein kinase 11-interacting protein-like [Selaginella moellendorffii]|eukprot:XP_024543168.1 serine/threonine-protein kinase 11-interacting protein-like [Selaginella moellendorffii]